MRTVLLRINGIHCETCITHLTRSLQATPGVERVDVDLMSRSARVEHDEGACKMNDLVSAVMRVGFQVDGFTVPEGHA